MLPRKLHLEQINRFHDEMERINKAIDNESDTSIKHDLCFEWFKMGRMGEKIDNFIEMELKNYLDTINK